MTQLNNMLSTKGEIRSRAEELSARMPALLIEAARVAHTVNHGIHGRRRAGPGETFWQFRHFQMNDPAYLVDWRRSATSDHLYIREREWEAAHTVWLWPDLSPSMQFNSHLASVQKRDHALLLTLALSDLLVRGGERVGLLGLRQPSTSKTVLNRLAETILHREANHTEWESLPPAARLSPHSECVFFSDFLEPLDQLLPRLEAIASQGIRGHLVQILDPAEESLPYEGRIRFNHPEGGKSVLAADTASLRPAYQQRLALHRQELKLRLHKLNWSYLLHHTDRPETEALLALHMHLSGLGHDYRSRSSDRKAGTSSEATGTIS